MHRTKNKAPIDDAAQLKVLGGLGMQESDEGGSGTCDSANSARTTNTSDVPTPLRWVYHGRG